MAKVFGSFSRLVSLLFRKDGQDITIRPNQATTYTAARDVQLPPGDEAHVIVSASSVAILTNKTFDADGTGNSITNIENADIKAGAAIDAAKIHDGSVSNTEFGYLNGVTSAIQTQLNTNATAISDHLADPTDAHDASAISNVPSGNLAATDVQGALNELQTDVDTRATSAALTAHTGASSGVHGVTGAVVGTTDSQSLTNKTLDDTSNVLLKGGNTTGATLRVGTNDAQSVVVEANNADRITARVASSANADIKLHGTSGVELPVGTAAQRPSSPVAGTIRANSDSNEFEGYLNGAWQAVGGGINEQPLKNYLKTWAIAAVSPGTISTVAAGGNISSSTFPWYADTTSGSSCVTATNVGGANLRGSLSYLAGLGTAASDGSRFFQFPAFQLEKADVGKPVFVTFDFDCNGSSGDYDVVVVRYSSIGTFQELIPVAGTASASSSTPSARVPSGVGQFRGFFVANSDSTSYYALRFRRIASSSSLILDTLYVGPQPQLAGAPVTDWQAYTPAITGFTTSALEGFWRRVGDVVQLRVQAILNATPSTTMQVGLPTGLSIDTTKAPGGAEFPVFGVIKVTDTGSGYYQGTVTQGNSNTALRFLDDDGGLVYNATVPISWVSGDTFSMTADVPIANWSSNVTMAERAVEEYAYNSNATNTATDTSSFAYGPAGGFVPNGAVGTNYTRRVRFQTPIQATDRVFVEIDIGGTGRWTPVENQVPFLSQGSNTYGISLNNQGNGTDFDVVFRAGGTEPSNAIYAGNGSAWSTISTWRWRVRKVSGGAAVGYPVGARNVVGDTTGTAVPAGYIGEVIVSTQSTLTAAAATGAYLALCSVPLTPGVWDISALAVQNRNAATFNDESEALVGTTAASNSGATVGTNYTFIREPAVSASGGSIPPFRVVVAANTTYYLNVRSNYSAGTPQWRGSLRATRVG